MAVIIILILFLIVLYTWVKKSKDKVLESLSFGTFFRSTNYGDEQGESDKGMIDYINGFFENKPNNNDYDDTGGDSDGDDM